MSLLAGLLAALAVLAGSAAGASGERRVRRVAGIYRGAAPSAVRRRRSGPRLPAALGAGVATFTFVGGPWGLVAAPFVGAAMARWVATLPSRADQERRLRLERDLPLALDLVAACLAAGSLLAPALRAGAAAVGGPLGEVLHRAAAAEELGGDPGRELAAAGLGPAAAALERARTSGTPPASALAAAAAAARASAEAAATARIRRVAVRAVVPLGLCLLPAFLLVGVVPVVVGLAAAALH